MCFCGFHCFYKCKYHSISHYKLYFNNGKLFYIFKSFPKLFFAFTVQHRHTWAHPLSWHLRGGDVTVWLWFVVLFTTKLDHSSVTRCGCPSLLLLLLWKQLGTQRDGNKPKWDNWKTMSIWFVGGSVVHMVSLCALCPAGTQSSGPRWHTWHQAFLQQWLK